MQKSESFEIWAYRIVLLLMVLVSWSGSRAKDKQMYAREYEYTGRMFTSIAVKKLK